MLSGELRCLLALERRGALAEDELFLLQRLEAGDRGEAELLAMVESVFGEEVWVRRNVWLDRQVECDLLVITRARVLNLNAKFYQGDFRYVDGKAFFNQSELRSNPVLAFQRSMDRLRDLARRSGLEDVPVDGRLVFLNPDYSVWVDGSNVWPCVGRADVLKMLQDLRAEAEGIEDRVGRGDPGGHGSRGGWSGYNIGSRHTVMSSGLDINWVASRLMTLESESKYWPAPLNLSHLQKMYRGLLCPSCGNRHLSVTQRVVECACGYYRVSKEQAVWETLQEFAMLLHDQPVLRTSELEWYLGGEVRRGFILNILKENFKITRLGRFTVFQNPFYREPRENCVQRLIDREDYIKRNSTIQNMNRITGVNKYNKQTKRK